MRSARLNLIIAGLLLVLIFLFNSVFIIQEGNVGIVTRFGKMVRDSGSELAVSEPGLHFKIPMIDKVRVLDARIQTLDSRADRFVTAEKKDLIIDSYVKWKISDPAAYYLTTAGGNILQAEELLRRRITNSLRSQIGRLTIQEVVAGQRSASTENEFDSAVPAASAVSKRDEVMQNALKDIGASAKELGIEIVDVRMKQINLPTEVSNSIYQRMRAEREAVARLHRSQGRKEAEVIRAQADREALVKLAEAQRDARKLKGEGDAEATAIYADAYSRDPELFSFLRSMDAYRKASAAGRDVMVLSPDSDFFRYFKRSDGKKSLN